MFKLSRNGIVLGGSYWWPVSVVVYFMLRKYNFRCKSKSKSMQWCWCFKWMTCQFSGWVQLHWNTSVTGSQCVLPCEHMCSYERSSSKVAETFPVQQGWAELGPCGGCTHLRVSAAPVVLRAHEWAEGWTSVVACSCECSICLNLGAKGWLLSIALMGKALCATGLFLKSWRKPRALLKLTFGNVWLSGYKPRKVIFN